MSSVSQGDLLKARERRLFSMLRKLARDYTDMPPMTVLMEAYHQQQKTLIGLELRDFLAMIGAAWTQIKKVHGTGRLHELMTEATNLPSPNVPSVCSADEIQLAKLCSLLQRDAGEKPFFLSYRAIAEAFGDGIHPETARRWMLILLACSVVKQTFIGKVGKASEFLYIGDTSHLDVPSEPQQTPASDASDEVYPSF